MIGVLIVTHYRLAEEFLQALQLIVGELKHFQAIGLDPGTPPEAMRARTCSIRTRLRVEISFFIVLSAHRSRPRGRSPGCGAPWLHSRRDQRRDGFRSGGRRHAPPQAHLRAQRPASTFWGQGIYRH